MEENIEYLMSLKEVDLLTLLVPENELHSPDSDEHRGKSIFNQIIKRSHDAIASFYNTHNKTIAFTQDMVLSLAPMLSNTNSHKIAIIVAIIVLKHGIKNYI